MSARTPLALHDAAPRVLLLDDDPLTLLVTGQALRARGFEVTEFREAVPALAAIEQGGVDCVIADIRMPEVDGYAFCRRLRATSAGATLPVVMLTALDDDAATQQAAEAGASDYCVKSCNWTLLAWRVRKAIDAARLESRYREAIADGPVYGPASVPAAFAWDPATQRVRIGADLRRLLDRDDLADSVRDLRLLALAAPADRRRLRRLIAHLLESGGGFRHELEIGTRSGRRRLRIDVHDRITLADGGFEVTGLVRDITPGMTRDPGLYRLTHYDPLTELPNRTWLLERLQRLSADPAEPVTSLAVLEIDRFEHVGEALGRAASERLLVELAERLRRLSRHCGEQALASGPLVLARIDAVAHLGGDAFALLVEGAERSAVLAVGQAVVEAMREPFLVAGREVFLRVSVGIHLSEPDADDPSQRLARAELARSAAAAAGGNGATVFETGMSEPGFDRLEMERDLHYAIGRGEMTMHYQPQVDALDGRLIGFEALMRWERGGRLQPAGTFITLAEQTGLIVPMGEWAINEACAALARLRALGHNDCVLAVNLSAQQLRTGRLPAVIASALAAHGLTAEQLEVELTESGMMQDPEVAVAQLRAVRDLGAGLAVDDFGTGYSSLSYLTRLPLTTLKIDRSFVQDIDTSERSRAVARAIVALGANLRLRVVAEGVETEAQRDALIALGCNVQQGWLYGRAQPLADACRFAQAQASLQRGALEGAA